MTIKLLTLQETGPAIDELRQAAGDVQDRIHQIAVSAFNHAFVHGDNTLCTRLCDALPTGQRVKALAFWFGHFSNGALTLSRDPETKSYRCNKDRFARRADLVTNVDRATELAMETTFADLTAEKDPKTLTLSQWLKSLKRTATNAENFDGTDVPKVSAELRAVASTVVAMVEKAIAEKNVAGAIKAA